MTFNGDFVSPHWQHSILYISTVCSQFQFGEKFSSGKLPDENSSPCISQVLGHLRPTDCSRQIFTVIFGYSGQPVEFAVPGWSLKNP